MQTYFLIPGLVSFLMFWWQSKDIDIMLIGSCGKVTDLDFWGFFRVRFFECINRNVVWTKHIKISTRERLWIPFFQLYPVSSLPYWTIYCKFWNHQFFCFRTINILKITSKHIFLTLAHQTCEWGWLFVCLAMNWWLVQVVTSSFPWDRLTSAPPLPWVQEKWW